MFGTVAKMKVKPVGDAALIAWGNALTKMIPGLLNSTIFKDRNEPHILWLSVVFETEEAYRKNAESPEQHRRWQQMRSALEEDIEWHDGDVIAYGLTGKPMS